MKFVSSALRTKLLLVLVWLFVFYGFHPAIFASPHSIKYLGIDHGLSNNSVRCIYQDHNGFMWFGTYDGLNRYNGYEFKVYRNKLNDTSSLPHNYIYAIHEDDQNHLWIGTGQGIAVYNSLSSHFSPAYYLPGPGEKKEKITVSTNAIASDKSGNVFIGTNGRGLLVQKAGTGVAIPILYEGANEKLTDYNVQAVLLDNKQRVWLFIESLGLCTYEYSTQKIRLVNSTLKSALSMQSDDSGNVWVGSSNGLFRYNTASGFMGRATENAGEKINTVSVVSLLYDNQHQLWIGTEGEGIIIVNTLTGKTDYLLPGQDKESLTSESVFAMYADKDNRKWVGTLKGGINVIDPAKKRFQSYAHNPLNPNSLINNFVSSFYEDEAHQLWIGTDGGGLSLWNRTHNSFTNFKHEQGNDRSLSNNLVAGICQDSEKNTWIATFGGGINRYNKTSGTFEHYKCINPVTGGENRNAWIVYEDRDKNLWATTFSSGRLYRFNRQQNRFEMFDNTLTDLISLTEDASGRLWGGNAHDLIRINEQNGRHAYYDMGKPVRAIYEDKKGNFWIGTEGGGLVLFNRQQSKITARYSDANGLCNNAVLNILEDNSGNLWLSTFNGLSRFNPREESFKNFYQSDGLQSNQFLYNAALRLQSGEFVFGGIKGFTIFHPDSLPFTNNTPEVFITGLTINNHPVTGASSYATKTAGNFIQELQIPYGEAVLSFDFAALEYSVPDKIAYAYFLDGWDKGWNYTGKVRTANYTHLKEGTYLLRIKSTNAAGDWNPKETTLKIIVLPPWYRTWWAYLIYIGILMGLVYLYLGYRTRQTKLEYKVKLAHLETEKEKELNEKKLSFFTEMSHEFRTPLTLIINPLKDLLKKEEHKPDAAELNIVYRNARRLMSLADQLLLFRSADTEGDQLKITKLNYSALCKDVYLCFTQEAKKKQVSYVFHCPDDLYLYADRQKIEIALYNLLSNAIKYTPDGGSIQFTVTENGGEVITAVADSGPGIPQAAGDQVFGKFYQAINNASVTKPGFGIGLFLVKKVAENHKGTICYQSEPGKGTTFLLTLLKGKAHFSGEFIGEEQLIITAPAYENIQELREETPERNKPAELVSESTTLLIVDDNEQIRTYIAGIFSGKYKVLEAGSGEQGLQMAKEQLPDLIISDVVMQGMSGMEMCQVIKKDAALGHIPVILLTGSQSPDGRLKGIEHGADEYLTKPFEKDLLVARVANLLQNRSTLQNYFYNEITLQHNNLKVSEEYREFLNKCIAVVEAHLEDDQFSIKTLAGEIGMSHSNLYKKVKSISGQSVNSFIRFIRLRKAAELFIHSNLNVNETALQVGINDVKYFREQFHKLFGMNPSEYVKKYRKAFSHSYRLNKSAFGTQEPPAKETAS